MVFASGMDVVAADVCVEAPPETASIFSNNPTISHKDASGTKSVPSGPVLSSSSTPILTVAQSWVAGNALSVFHNAGTWTDPDGDPVQMSASVGSVQRNDNGTWSWSYVPTQAHNGLVVTITASDNRGASSSIQFTLQAQATVVSSKVYYKSSSFSDFGVSSALDHSKSLAKSGPVAKLLDFSNVINSIHGINGLVFDVAGLSSMMLSPSDFSFRISPIGTYSEQGNPPSSWGLAPSPSFVGVSPGSGTIPARIRIEWPDLAIANRWLQVKILANTNTGLNETQVFYIGHLFGEVDGLVEQGAMRVSMPDMEAIRARVGLSAGVSSPHDINKNGMVSVADIVAVRPLVNTASLLAIAIPPSGSAEEGEYDYDRTLRSSRESRSIATRITNERFDVPQQGLSAQGLTMYPDSTEVAFPVDLGSLDDYFRRYSRGPRLR
jgi:hypothetical protein